MAAQSEEEQKVCLGMGNENKEHCDDRNEKNSEKGDTKNLLCQYCNKAFQKQKNLKLHLRIHTGEKKMECPICGKCFIQSCHLKRHIRSHSGEKPFTCDICGNHFTQNGHLRVHLKSHFGNKNYQCEYCQMSFVQNSQLKRHMRSHMNIRPYKCNFCDKTYKFSDHLYVHMRTHTGEMPYQCSLCEKTFHTSANLNAHRKIHNKYVDRKFKCHICVKKFHTNYALIKHMIVHSSDAPFSCHLCSKKFKYKGNLKHHFDVHSKDTNVKSLKCVICNKWCTSFSRLKDHMLTHYDEKYKTHKCEICCKTFRVKSSLQMHFSLHTGLKLAYRCVENACAMEFQSKQGIRLHVKGVHNVGESERDELEHSDEHEIREKDSGKPGVKFTPSRKSYKCPLECQCTFESITDLTVHLKYHIKEEKQRSVMSDDDTAVERMDSGSTQQDQQNSCAVVCDQIVHNTGEDIYIQTQTSNHGNQPLVQNSNYNVHFPQTSPLSSEFIFAKHRNSIIDYQQLGNSSSDPNDGGGLPQSKLVPHSNRDGNIFANLDVDNTIRNLKGVTSSNQPPYAVSTDTSIQSPVKWTTVTLPIVNSSGTTVESFGSERQAEGVIYIGMLENSDGTQSQVHFQGTKMQGIEMDEKTMEELVIEHMVESQPIEEGNNSQCFSVGEVEVSSMSERDSAYGSDPLCRPTNNDICQQSFEESVGDQTSLIPKNPDTSVHDNTTQIPQVPYSSENTLCADTMLDHHYVLCHNTITAPKDSSWNTNTQNIKEAQKDISWNTQITMEKEQESSWNAQNTSEAQRDTSWNAHNTAEAQRHTSWNAQNTAEAQRHTSWNAQNTAEAQRHTSWNTQSTMEAQKDYSCAQNRTETQKSSSQNTQYTTEAEGDNITWNTQSTKEAEKDSKCPEKEQTLKNEDMCSKDVFKQKHISANDNQVTSHISVNDNQVTSHISANDSHVASHISANDNQVTSHTSVNDNQVTSHISANDSHVASHNNSSDLQQCPFCNEYFPDKTWLKIHLQSHMTSSEKTIMYMCHFCNEEFSSKEGLKTHLKSHV